MSICINLENSYIYEFEGNLMLFALRRRIISRKRLRNKKKKLSFPVYIIHESLYHFTVHIFHIRISFLKALRGFNKFVRRLLELLLFKDQKADDLMYYNLKTLEM